VNQYIIEFRDDGIEIPVRAGLAEIAEEDQVGDLGVVEEVVGRHIDGDGHPFAQGEAVDHFLHLDELLPEVLVDVDDHGLIEVLLASPVVVKRRDVDSHLLGDHPGRRAVEAVLAEDAAGAAQDGGFHRFRVLAGLFERGGHGRLPVHDSII